MSTRVKRIVQIFLSSVFALAGFFIIVGTALNGKPMAGIVGVVALFMAVVFYAVFEMQIRSFARAGAVVKANIEDCAKSLFDAAGRTFPGYDLHATTPSHFVGFVREADNEAAFTTEGACGDVKVSVASHVSVMGRQFGEVHHTYSHVCVDVLGLTKPFRITKEGIDSKLGKAVGITKDAKTGDAKFDEMFVVETEEELAGSVLDESVRGRLQALQARVSSVSSDIGGGQMSVLLSSRGLALRWPGDITPELAIFIRDLLVDMRTNMLAHENRAALRVGTAATTGGYRVSVEEPAEAEAEAEAEARDASG